MKLESKNHEQSRCFLWRLVQQAPVQHQTYTRNSQTLSWIKKKKKYHDEKQTYLGEKMLRKWYLKVAGDMHFTWPDFSSCSFSMSSVPMCTEGLSSEERTGEGNTHTVETANLAPSFSTLLLTTCVISDKALWATYKDRNVFPVSTFLASSKEPGALYALNKCLLNNQTRECTLWNNEKFKGSLY